MKKTELRQAMRWAAGGLYVAFWLMQMLCLQYTLQAVSLFSMPAVTFLEVCTLFVSAAAAVYIFSVSETRAVIGRAVPAVTLLYGVYELLFFQAQLVPLQLSFSLLSMSADTSETLQTVCVWLRIVLAGAAAVFVYYSVAPPPEAEEDKRMPSNPQGRKPMSRREEKQADKKAPPKGSQGPATRQPTKTVHKAGKK